MAKTKRKRIKYDMFALELKGLRFNNTEMLIAYHVHFVTRTHEHCVHDDYGFVTQSYGVGSRMIGCNHLN